MSFRNPVCCCTYMRQLHLMNTVRHFKINCRALSTWSNNRKYALHRNVNSCQNNKSTNLRCDDSQPLCFSGETFDCSFHSTLRPVSNRETVRQFTERTHEGSNLSQSRVQFGKRLTIWPCSANSNTKTSNSCERSLFRLNSIRNYSTGSGYLCIHGNQRYRDYLRSLQTEYDKLMAARTGENSEVRSSKKVNQRLLELSSVVNHFTQMEEKLAEVAELENMTAAANDSDIVAMATQEKGQLLDLLEEDERELVLLLAGEPVTDHRDIILEVSAGVGGQEAMLFTSKMFDMYERYADYKGWMFTTLGCDMSETGGMRRASAAVAGTDVFKHLKFEGGVHRVQRVPQTEKSGRVHTSTMTVAILPQPKDIDITINPKDLLIETFRASGKGGQSVNTTDSAVRITHIPTKTVAECQVERSQSRNKDLAMQVLRSRLYEAELHSQTAQTQSARKLQTGNAGRSEKIRTYNFPQDRITDHRLVGNIHQLDVFMNGGDELDDLIHGLMWKVKCEIVEDLVEEFTNIRDSKKS